MKKHFIILNFKKMTELFQNFVFIFYTLLVSVDMKITTVLIILFNCFKSVPKVPILRPTKTLCLLFLPHCCVWTLGRSHSKLHLPSAPPPLNEGESLVSRILQLGPPGTKFLGQGGKKSTVLHMKQSMDAGLSVFLCKPFYLMSFHVILSTHYCVVMLVLES